VVHGTPEIASLTPDVGYACLRLTKTSLGASATAGSAASTLSAAFGFRERRRCRTGPPRGGHSHGRYRSRVRAAYLRHSEVRVEIGRTLGCCQANANQSLLFATQQVLGDEKVAPLAKSDVAFLLEPDSCVDVPFEVEVIVH
jgi:hypothetical protein